jgi:cytochrome P450
MAATGCPVHEGFDPLAPDFLADPYAVLAALPLREAPLFYAPSIGYYVLTRHADIEQVFRDPATFSAAVAQAPLVPRRPRSCWPAGTGRSRRWSAWTSRRTPGCASPRRARSA